MIVAAIAILASGVAARPPEPPMRRLSPAQIREEVARCGVAIARVTIRDEPELQEDVIAIAVGPPLDDAHLACLARASLAATTYVEFDAPDQQKRYDGVYYPIEDGRDVADARVWLGRRGLLATLPNYDPARQTLAAYGWTLEALCGITRGAILTTDRGILTIRRDLIVPVTKSPFHGAMTDDQFECLVNASSASNLREHGSMFGFIGNAAEAPAE